MAMVYEFRGIKPALHPTVFLAPSAQVIGDVTIGESSSVWFNAVIRGDVHTIKIGSGTNVQDGSILHCSYQKWPLTIGDGVTIGHGAILHGCTVGDYVLVGMGATVLDGAEIGNECILGARCLVTQKTKIPPRSLVMGSPAKVVRSLTDEEVQNLHKSSEHYKRVVSWYREGEERK